MLYAFWQQVVVVMPLKPPTNSGPDDDAHDDGNLKKKIK